MKKASISETKNHLSRLLEEVKQGTTILILDRTTPVARLEPVAADEQSNAGRVAALVRQGLATAPRCRFDSAAFLSRRMIRLPEGASAVQALLADREEER
jgi:prevent-host-death family protein